MALIPNLFVRYFLCSDTDEEPPVSAPTRDMAKLWGRVRQLRAFLRTQKQEFKVSSASVSRTYEVLKTLIVEDVFFILQSSSSFIGMEAEP